MVHHNLPWIESPFFESELNSAELSPQDKEFVQHYAENGYVIFDTGLSNELIEKAKVDLVDAYKASHAKTPDNFESSYKIQDAWRYNPEVKAIASSPVILDKLRLLYKRRPIPFQTLNFSAGSQQDTHSDMIHFSSIPERFMCGVWVALEDITEDCGPLHYYPKSHKLPFYNMSDMGVKASDSKKDKNIYMDYSDYYVVFIQEVIKSLGLQKKTLTIKKGQALIWAANLLHGGEPIMRPGSTRHSQVTHYYFEDCTYFTPLFTDFAIKQVFLRYITDITTGRQIDNKYLGEVVKDEGLKELLLKNKMIQSVTKPITSLKKFFNRN